MSLIVVGGSIGLGKTAVSKLLGEALGSEVFYESVEDNPFLDSFYTASPEESAAKRYPFLLQLYFLHTRFSAIKRALYDNNNVLDRSIYEDWYFCKVNNDLGKISDVEFELYSNLLNNMMEELEGTPKKAPDLMVYLKASFETMIYRIGLRGREFEQDQELFSYYRKLWEGYDDWVNNHYSASQVLVIDMDKMDVVNSRKDAEAVVQAVKTKLKEIGEQ